MKTPLWLTILDIPAMGITTLWFWTGILRYGRVKGTRFEVACKNLMCELRPVLWPAFIVRDFYQEIDWHLSPHTEWYEAPGWHYAGMLLDLGCFLYYWKHFKDDDDDDRWQRRRKWLSKTIKTRLTLHVPAHTHN